MKQRSSYFMGAGNGAWSDVRPDYADGAFHLMMLRVDLSGNTLLYYAQPAEFKEGVASTLQEICKNLKTRKVKAESSCLFVSQTYVCQSGMDGSHTLFQYAYLPATTRVIKGQDDIDIYLKRAYTRIQDKSIIRLERSVVAGRVVGEIQPTCSGDGAFMPVVLSVRDAKAGLINNPTQLVDDRLDRIAFLKCGGDYDLLYATGPVRRLTQNLLNDKKTTASVKSLVK